MQANNDIEWPPLSPDFDLCDFFVGKRLKNTVHRTHSKTLDDLRAVIETEVEKIGMMF